MKFYRQSDYFPLRGLIPSLYVVGTLAASFVATVISERMLCCHNGLLWQGLHVLIGAAFLFLTLIIIYIYEKNLVKFVKDHYRKSRKSKNSWNMWYSIYDQLEIYVSLRLRVQNAVPAQPCVGKLGISLVLLNFLHCNFRLWFKTP